jgi:hypothetical protein
VLTHYFVVFLYLLLVLCACTCSRVQTSQVKIITVSSSVPEGTRVKDSAEDLRRGNKSLECAALLSKEAEDFRRVNMSLDCEAPLFNTFSSAFELAVLC